MQPPHFLCRGFPPLEGTHGEGNKAAALEASRFVDLCPVIDKHGSYYGSYAAEIVR